MADLTDAPSEREKWQQESQLKRDELALKARELDIRERESRRARWTNPLVLAIAGAALAAAGNVVATYYSGAQQRENERVRHIAEQEREREKAESQLILEVIKTPDPDKAAANLDFLVQTNLISEKSRRIAISSYVQSRSPGTGASLPSTTEPGAFAAGWDQPVPGIACRIKNHTNLYVVAEAIAKRVSLRWPETKTKWEFKGAASATGLSEVRRDDKLHFLVRHAISLSELDTETRSFLHAPRDMFWNFTIFGDGPNEQFLGLEKSLAADLAALPSGIAACRLLRPPAADEATSKKSN